MKKLSNLITVVGLAVATPVLAASAPASSGLSPMVIAFFAFFGLLVVLQLVPGIVLLFSMLKELVSDDKKKAVAAVTQSKKD